MNGAALFVAEGRVGSGQEGAMNECPRFLQNSARRCAATGFVKNALVPGNMPALVIDVSLSLSVVVIGAVESA